jgi:hypothetical protein
MKRDNSVPKASKSHPSRRVTLTPLERARAVNAILAGSYSSDATDETLIADAAKELERRTALVRDNVSVALDATPEFQWHSRPLLRLLVEDADPRVVGSTATARDSGTAQCVLLPTSTSAAAATADVAQHARPEARGPDGRDEAGFTERANPISVSTAQPQPGAPVLQSDPAVTAVTIADSVAGPSRGSSSSPLTAMLTYWAPSEGIRSALVPGQLLAVQLCQVRPPRDNYLQLSNSRATSLEAIGSPNKQWPSVSAALSVNLPAQLLATPPALGSFFNVAGRFVGWVGPGHTPSQAAPDISDPPMQGEAVVIAVSGVGVVISPDRADASIVRSLRRCKQGTALRLDNLGYRGFDRRRNCVIAVMTVVGVLVRRRGSLPAFTDADGAILASFS